MIRKYTNLIENGSSEWDVAEAVLQETYPTWNHIPNRGILKGNIAAAIKAAIQSERIKKENNFRIPIGK